uniref:TIDP3222 n=2 Tax=Arundo donax TaxID=35708 RepID=A0A0A9FQF8_ARUDO
MHITRLAPELSTTLRLVLIWMNVLICWQITSQ